MTMLACTDRIYGDIGKVFEMVVGGFWDEVVG